ncbi:hypothetical protein IH979_02665 [Patescibacteria group bacterium]|nr:hypothetical protein [Patescibacteria group bacterium]
MKEVVREKDVSGEAGPGLQPKAEAAGKKEAAMEPPPDKKHRRRRRRRKKTHEGGASRVQAPAPEPQKAPEPSKVRPGEIVTFDE